MWFEGEPGPMVPKNSRVVGRKGGTGSKVPKSGSNTGKELAVEKKTAVKRRSNSDAKKNVVKEEPVVKEEIPRKSKKGVAKEKKSQKSKVKVEKPDIKEESSARKTRQTRRVAK